MDEQLRREVKLLKALQNISYKELSNHLGITAGSFYNWVHGLYTLSPERQNILKEIINNLKAKEN